MRSWPKINSISYYQDVFDPRSYFSRNIVVPQIPVFMFHDLEPQEFEMQLRFLKENGYEAISCEHALWDDPESMQVILTFDDGLRSVWTIAFPLLRKYGFKGTAFISPGLIQEGETTPNLDDLSTNNTTLSNYGNRVLFNWEEARQMHMSGVIDLQLHGFAHSRVFISDRIIDFEMPSRKDPISGISAWQVHMGSEDIFTEKLQPGQPIYENGSRWGESMRYLDDEELRRVCIEYVEMNGGVQEFFIKNSWRKELSRVVTEYKSKNRTMERVETNEGKRDNLIKLLKQAKKLLEKKIGKVCRHFALPWAEGNLLINEVAESVGIEHIYWGHICNDDIRKFSSDSVRHHARLKEMFILRLPGNNRQSVVKFLFKEYKRIKRSDVFK